MPPASASLLTSLARALTAVVLLAPSVVAAGPKKDAQAHIATAMEAHEKQNFELAATELQAAYALDPQPDLLYAIAQVYGQLERCGDAITYYQRYLDTRPPAQAAVDTRTAIDACKAKTPPPSPASEPASTPPVAAVTVTTSTPWYKDPIGDALVVTGVAAGVFGIVFYGKATSDLDAAEAAPNLAAYDELVDRAASRRTYSVVLIGGGIALIGAGVARYMLRDRHTKEAPAVGLVPTARGGLVTWGGQF